MPAALSELVGMLGARTAGAASGAPWRRRPRSWGEEDAAALLSAADAETLKHIDTLLLSAAGSPPGSPGSEENQGDVSNVARGGAASKGALGDKAAMEKVVGTPESVSRALHVEWRAGGARLARSPEEEPEAPAEPQELEPLSALAPAWPRSPRAGAAPELPLGAGCAGAPLDGNGGVALLASAPQCGRAGAVARSLVAAADAQARALAASAEDELRPWAAAAEARVRTWAAAAVEQARPWAARARGALPGELAARAADGWARARAAGSAVAAAAAAATPKGGRFAAVARSLLQAAAARSWPELLRWALLALLWSVAIVHPRLIADALGLGLAVQQRSPEPQLMAARSVTGAASTKLRWSDRLPNPLPAPELAIVLAPSEPAGLEGELRLELRVAGVFPEQMRTHRRPQVCMRAQALDGADTVLGCMPLSGPQILVRLRDLPAGSLTIFATLMSEVRKLASDQRSFTVRPVSAITKVPDREEDTAATAATTTSLQQIVHKQRQQQHVQPQLQAGAQVQPSQNGMPVQGAASEDGCSTTCTRTCRSTFMLG
jgi:hypothetical protein